MTIATDAAVRKHKLEGTPAFLFWEAEIKGKSAVRCLRFTKNGQRCNRKAGWWPDCTFPDSFDDWMNRGCFVRDCGGH